MRIFLTSYEISCCPFLFFINDERNVFKIKIIRVETPTKPCVIAVNFLKNYGIIIIY